MRIPWTAAEREQRLLLALRCGVCGAMNVPHAKPRVELDPDGQGAACSECGYAGPLPLFLPGGPGVL